jgi:hypothetical protein
MHTEIREYVKIQFLPLGEEYDSITKTGLLMLFKEIVTADSESPAKHIIRSVGKMRSLLIPKCMVHILTTRL